MAKQIKANVKFRVPAGKATPAPPVGSILGAHGVNMMEFISAFNDRTKDMHGIVPVKVAVYDDRSFDFVVKTGSTAAMIRDAAGVKKGSGVPHKEKVGQITPAQIAEIVEVKMQDLNANDPEAAAKIVAGQARSMGITVAE